MVAYMLEICWLITSEMVDWNKWNMKVNLANFDDHSRDLYDLVIIPQDIDIGGGRITKSEIDVIQEFPSAKSLWISGLNQGTFEYLILNYGAQFEAIAFFKNKMVSDLSLLGNLRALKYVYYFFNQRVTKLWDMQNNENLRGLSIYDFSKLHTIDEVATAPSLEYFAIGNAVWDKIELETLKPLVGSNVKHFVWQGKKILDGDFLCLTQSNITELDVAISHLTIDELAQIVAHIPNGWVSKPYVECDEKYYLCKGKRALTKGKDDAKFEAYLQEFEALVEKYKRNKEV